MDVKSIFLNGILNEEACIELSKWFIDPYLPDYVFKLKKALYGLKETSQTQYERLTMFLFEKGYNRWRVDKTLFIKHLKYGLIVAQIYVDDNVWIYVWNIIQGVYYY